MQLQYIGARYVPKWYVNSVNQSSDWEVNVEYEALTWVTTQNNHLYLSKKTVPDNIGTPAQNTEYWLDMGEMTGDLQNIQDQIDAITANMGDLTDLDTTDKSSLVAAINEVLAGSGGGGGGYTDPNKKVFVISDSYGTTFPDTGSSYKTFFEYMQIFGMDVRGFAYSGDGFVRSAGSGTFEQNFTRDSLNIPESDRDEVGTILVAAGRNDWTASLNDIINAIISFVTYCKTAYKNARVVVAYIGNGENNATFGTKAQQFAVYKAYSRAMECGATYMNGSEAILRCNGAMSSDGMHPSEHGRFLLGRYLVEGLKAGSCSVRSDEIDVNFTFATGVGGNLGCVGLHEYMEDGVIYIEPKGSATVGLFTFTTTNPASYPLGEHDTLLGTIGSGMLIHPYREIEIPLGLTPIRTGGGSTYANGYYHGSLVIDPDGKVILRHYSETAHNDVTMVLVGNFKLSIPAICC